MKSLFIIILCFCFCYPTLYAEGPTYKIRHYSVGDGLSDHRIFCILQHSSGFVWVGCEDGVNRFDGYRFHPVSMPGLSHLSKKPISSRIWNLVEVQNGLILTFSRISKNERESFYLVDPATMTIYARTHFSDSSSPFCFFNASDTICLNKEQALPFFTEVQNQDTLGNRFVLTKDPPVAKIMYRDGDDIDLSTDWYTLSNPTSPVGKNFRDAFYIRHLNGLVLVSINNSVFDTYLNKDLGDWEYGLNGRSIIKPEPDQVLFSLERQAPRLVNLKTGKDEPFIIQNSENGQPVKSLSIRGMYQYNDSTIIATSVTGTIFSFNWKTRKTSTCHREYFNAIYHSVLLKSGKLLVAGRPFLQDHPSLALFDPGTKELTPLFFNYHFSWAPLASQCYLLEAEDGTVWFGMATGLFHLDMEQKTVIEACKPLGSRTGDDLAFPVHPILNSPYILVLHEDSDRNLWVGMENGGIQVLDPELNQILEFDMEDGLSDNTVCGIIPGENGLWVTTYNGLNYLAKPFYSIRNFYRESGMPHNEFNRFSFYKASDNEIYLGTMNGFCRFDPEDLLNKEANIFLLLSEAQFFEKDGKTQKILITHQDNDPAIVIPGTNRSCSFTMALSNHAHPESNQFSYLLEPQKALQGQQEEEWRQNGNNRKIQFEYLPAGRYVLRVRATSLAGVIPQDYRINLLVKEVFYKSAWFYLLLGLIATTIIYLFYRFRLNNAIRLEKLKTRLSSDLHDDVGSVLSGVAYQMELLEYSVNDENKTLVKQIAESSRRAMSHMRDVVWAIDSRNGSFLDLTERMKEFADELLVPLGIQCVFDFHALPLKKEAPAPVRHDLLLIFKEFLTNAVRHSEADQIRVSLGMHGGEIEMVLKDNGKGLPKEAVTGTGQGLKNMRLRAEKLNADFEMIHENGFGVRIRTKP